MNNLKKMRIEKGLTQEQCSRGIGISLRTYQYLENNRTENPTSQVIDACCIYFKKKYEELFRNSINNKLEDGD